MLELNPLKTSKWISYDKDPSIRFEINPLSDKQHAEILKSSRDGKDRTDIIEVSRRCAKRVINNWDGVGEYKKEAGRYVFDGDGKKIPIPTECHDVSKAQFGERYAYDVMPWLIEEAMKFNKEIEAEEEAAKKP